MDISERKRGDRQKRAHLIARESNAMQRDRLPSVLLEPATGWSLAMPFRDVNTAPCRRFLTRQQASFTAASLPS